MTLMHTDTENKARGGRGVKPLEQDKNNQL